MNSAQNSEKKHTGKNVNRKPKARGINTVASENTANPRRVALDVLYEVENGGAYANIALNDFLRQTPDSAERSAFITELVYGTLRMRGTVDYILSQFYSKPLQKLPLKILLILRMGVYQLCFMSRIPESAAVNESVKLAKKYGHQGTVSLTNAVLRNVARNKDSISYPDKDKNPVEFIAAVSSHPLWLVEEWVRRFGFADTLAMCEFDNQPAPFTMRVNTLRISRENALQKLSNAGITAEALDFPLDGIKVTGGDPAAFIREGLLYPQQQSSMLAAHALAPKAACRVLDVCAAPGGKTTHMAALMQNQGEIRAFDLHEHKLELIKSNAARLGIDIIKTHQADSRNLDTVPDDWADYILVDAPCSGLGVLRSRPDSRWRKTPETSAEIAGTAYEILCEAARKLKPGGIMLFSTCTISETENEENVRRFLAEHQNFSPAAIECYPELFDGRSSLQVLPQIHGIEGFFFARFRRDK